MATSKQRARQRRRAAHQNRPASPEPKPAVTSEHPSQAATRRRIRIAAGLGMVAAAALAVALSGPGDGPSDPSPTTIGLGDASDAQPIPTVPPGIPPAIIDPPVDPSVLGGLAFSDVTESAGFEAPQANRALAKDGDFAGGASVVDVDGDGHLDVFLPRVGLPDRLMRNNGNGTFTDIADEAGFGDPGPGSSVGVWNDVDGDDDPDLYLLSAEGAPPKLWLNDGTGRFTDGTEKAGLVEDLPEDRIDARYGAAFADIDQDGDLDLVTTHYNVAALSNSGELEPSDVPPCESAPARRFTKGPAVDQSQSRLYLNDGNGHFEDRTSDLGLPLHQVIAFTPTFADIDNDGWPDLLITGDFCTSRVFHNDQGKGFTDVTERLGLGTDENGMGSVVADIDGDGRLDWFVTGISFPAGTGEARCLVNNSGCSGNRLWLNRAGGKWTDATDRYGLRDGKWGWGAVAQDLDNDGDRDLLMVDGYRLGARGPGGDKLRPYFDYFIENQTRLWLNSGGTPFVQVATPAGLTSGGLARSSIAFDHDRDGDLDLLVSRGEGAPTLYRNDLPQGSAWLGVTLADQTSPNRAGVGARVTVRVTPDGPEQVAEISTAGTYSGSVAPLAHFGFGPGVTTLDRVEVRWPDGGKATVLNDVNVNQTLRVTR